MRPSAISEAEAIAALRYHLRRRKNKQQRLAKAYLKIEKLQPRSFQIASLIQQISNGIAVVKAMNGIDYHIQKDAEMFQHLTGKVEDKTAGRNQLGFRPGK